ncbi:TIGR03790 family protein [Thermosulfuriphilus sp.]
MKLLFFIILFLSLGYPAWGGHPLGDRVLVVANKNSPDSLEVAHYYLKRRQIPKDHLLVIETSEKEEISRREFEESIKIPIARFIEARAWWDRILFIVLTPGIPLKIKGSGGRKGHHASVDSELCLLYRDMLYGPHRLSGPLPNPYFATPIHQPFGHQDYDIYLVTRLAGYSKEAALALIDRAFKARAYERPKFLLNAKTPGRRPGDNWLYAAALLLKKKRTRVVFEWRQFVTEAYNLMGYSSWGSNDPRYPRDRRLKLSFLPGGLATTFVSTNARTFRRPPVDWKIGRFGKPLTYFAGSPQSLIGDLIEAGVTGVAGNVYEPYLSACARPHLLFSAYLAGRNLAESFYRSLRYLSWQEVVIGDPLLSPYGPSQARDDTNWYLSGRYFQKRKALYKRTREAPKSPKKLVYLAEIAARQGWEKKALKHLKEALKLDPQGPYRLMIARLYLEQGKKRAAYQALSGPIPEKAPFLVAKADLLLALGKKEEAYSLAQRANQLDPGTGITWLLLGQTALATGKTAQAIKALEKACAKLGFNPQALFGLAQALKKAGDESRAEKIFKELLNYPEAVFLFPSISKELKELERNRKN